MHFKQKYTYIGKYHSPNMLFLVFIIKTVTCSAILALLDNDDDLRSKHELLNTERIL